MMMTTTTIKRFLAALCLALCAASAAQAAPACAVSDAKYIHAGQVGPNWWIYWWCADGTWQWTSVLPGEMTSDRITASMAWWFGLASDAQPWLPEDDPAITGLRDAAQAAASYDHVRPPTAAPAPWWVQRNGTQTTRPTYPVINGKRATASDGRATIGAPCDCAGAIVEGKTTYCKVPPSASVAVCSQVPPEAEPAPDPGLPPPKPPAASHAGLLGSAGGGVMPRTPIAPRPARV